MAFRLRTVVVTAPRENIVRAVFRLLVRNAVLDFIKMKRVRARAKRVPLEHMAYNWVPSPRARDALNVQVGRTALQLVYIPKINAIYAQLVETQIKSV